MKIEKKFTKEELDKELDNVFNNFFGEELKEAERILKEEKESKMKNNNNGFVVTDPFIAQMFTSEKAREEIFNSIFGNDLKKAEEILKEKI